MRRSLILTLILLVTACSSSDEISSPTDIPPTAPPLIEPLCQLYPAYCVPFGSDAPVPGLETAGVRTVDPDQAAPGVIRGMTADGRPFLGDPNAPVELVEVRDFGCSHCREYHLNDLPRLIEDFVLTGEVQFSTVTVVIGGGPSPTYTAAMTSLCAGEQGALWEMSDQLYQSAAEVGSSAAYTPEAVTTAAAGIGLDREALAVCINSNRYQSLLDQSYTFASDNGVSSVPTVLVRYRGQELWTPVGRDYNTIRGMVEAAP